MMAVLASAKRLFGVMEWWQKKGFNSFWREWFKLNFFGKQGLPL